MTKAHSGCQTEKRAFARLNRTYGVTPSRGRKRTKKINKKDTVYDINELGCAAY